MNIKTRINEVLYRNRIMQLQEINKLTKEKKATDSKLDKFNSCLKAREITPDQLGKSYDEFITTIQKKSTMLKEAIVSNAHDLAEKDASSFIKLFK